jgi:DNA replication initiation complex subunit (GINS family)
MQDTFFDDVVKYIQGKMNILANQKNELFATDEKEKTLIQLQNIKKILKELYDRREKKVINLAINKARTKSSIIDTSSLMDEERALFDSLHKVLEGFRESVLDNVIAAKAPSTSRPAQAEDCTSGQEPEKEQALNTSSEEHKTKAENKTVGVRFLSPVPEFVGPELKLYGPYEEDDTSYLPEQVAKVLLDKGRAEIYDDQD